MNKNHQKHLALSLLCALFATLPVLAPEGYEPVETKPVEIRKEPSNLIERRKLEIEQAKQQEERNRKEQEEREKKQQEARNQATGLRRSAAKLDLSQMSVETVLDSIAMDHKFISNLSELDRDILNKKLNDAKEDPALEENKEEIIDAIKEIKKVNAKASKAAEGSKKESIPVKSTTIEISPESFKPTTEADKAEAAENLVSRLTEMKTKLDAAENLKNSEMKKSDTYSDERNESSLNLENVKKSKAARFKQYWNSEEGAYWRQGDPRAMRLTEEQAFEESLEDNEDFQKLKNTHEFGIARSYRMQQDTVKAAVESYGKLSREYNALEKELNNKYPEAASTYRLKIAREAASKRK